MTNNDHTAHENTARFDAESELARIRRARQAKRRQRWQASRLTRYRAELTSLRRSGASLAELCAWLAEHRVHVVRSTVARFINALPEFAKEFRSEDDAHA